jgi:hypothetical protein
MKHKGRRMALAGMEIFIGLGALGGGVAVLTGAFDRWLPLTWLADTPFPDYLIPGLVLLIVVGGGMLLAASTAFVQHEWAVLLQACMGLIMIGFEAVEAVIIDRYPQAVVASTVVQQILFSGLGVALLGLAISLWLSEYRSHSTFIRHVRHA